MKQAFIAIDVQNDFCKGGALAVNDGDAVVPIINQLWDKFPLRLLTQDWHPKDHLSFASQHAGAQVLETIEFPYGMQTLWPDHCVQGSAGAEFHKDLLTDGAMATIRKGHQRDIDSYSAFLENDGKTATGLQGYLKELHIQQIILAGLATDFCVKFSALDGRAMGFEVIVIEDACRAIDMNGSLDSAYKEMSSAGVIFKNSNEF